MALKRGEVQQWLFTIFEWTKIWGARQYHPKIKLSESKRSKPA